MFDVMDAYNFWAWTIFIAAAILGGMFIVNLFLAVIFDEFMRAQQAANAEKEVRRGASESEAPIRPARTRSSIAPPNPSSILPCNLPSILPCNPPSILPCHPPEAPLPYAHR